MSHTLKAPAAFRHNCSRAFSCPGDTSAEDKPALSLTILRARTGELDRRGSVSAPRAQRQRTCHHARHEKLSTDSSGVLSEGSTIPASETPQDLQASLYISNPWASKCGTRILRNKKCALHFGHSTSRRNASLFASVITPITP